MANLANFVGSGAIQRAQNTIIGLNHVTPARQQDLRSMVSRVTTDLRDLSDNIDTVDTWLDGVSGTVDVMHRNLPAYQYWFSPAGMTGFDRATVAASYIGTVVPSVGSIYSGGFWLVPLLDSLGKAVGAVQQSKWDFEREAPAWRKLFIEDFFPVDKNPAINITSITGPDGREMIGNVQDVLRILGGRRHENRQEHRVLRRVRGDHRDGFGVHRITGPLDGGAARESNQPVDGGPPR